MQIRNKSNLIETSMIISLGLIPWGLVIGIFFAELFFNISTILGLFLLNKKKIKIDKLFLNILICYWFYLIISNTFFFFNSEIQPKIINCIGYIRFILFFLVIREIFFIINYKKIILIQGISVITISLDIIFQKIFGFNIFGILAKENRFSSFFGDEFISGSFISKLFFPFLIYVSYILKKKNIIFFITFIIFLISVFFSGERMATLTVLITIFLTLIFYKDKRIIILILLFISIVSFSFISKNNRFTEVVKVFSPTEQTNDKIVEYKVRFTHLLNESGHLPLFITSFKIWEENKLFGSGVRTFRNKCSDERFQKINYKYSTCSTHPHNYYLEILAETGLIGFILIFSFILMHLYRSIKIILYNDNEGLDMMLLKAYVVTNLSFFLIISSGSFFNNWISIVFWINLTFLSSITKKVNYN